MNTLKITFVIFFTSILAIGCNKEKSASELYNSYISLTINSGTNLGFQSDSIVQIYLRNNSEHEFERECTISYVVKNQVSGSSFTAETEFFNVLNPQLPSGQLKLIRRDTQFFNINLTSLSWNNQTIKQLPIGQYSIYVQVFIKDPSSPGNIITSNNLTININK
jgi:hypothetical protein